MLLSSRSFIYRRLLAARCFLDRKANKQSVPSPHQIHNVISSETGSHLLLNLGVSLLIFVSTSSPNHSCSARIVGRCVKIHHAFFLKVWSGIGAFENVSLILIFFFPPISPERKELCCRLKASWVCWKPKVKHPQPSLGGHKLCLWLCCCSRSNSFVSHRA